MVVLSPAGVVRPSQSRPVAYRDRAPVFFEFAENEVIFRQPARMRGPCAHANRGVSDEVACEMIGFRPLVAV